MSWRRATAPPFGPDGTLSYSSSPSSSPNNNNTVVTNSAPYFSKYSPHQENARQVSFATLPSNNYHHHHP